MLTPSLPLDKEELARDLPGVAALFAEPMAQHTSFAIGGPADLMLLPSSLAELQASIAYCRSRELSFFLLGGGSNLLVADRGIRGVVLNLTGLAGVTVHGCTLCAQAGTPVTRVAEEAARRHLSGLEFLYGLPGTIGGAAWMNARCYGGEIADRLVSVTMLSYDGNCLSFDCRPEQFSYKKSPFQTMEGCIVDVELALECLSVADAAKIWQTMEAHLADREQKGHFRAPSAGSLFKNDRRFGAPTGKILDELGLRGTVCGGAAIADFHGNIFVNNGNATAADVLALMVQALELAHRKRGIILEPEVRLVGEWLPEELAQLEVVQ